MHFAPGARNSSSRGLAEAHAAAVDGVVDNAGKHAVFAGGVGDEFVVDWFRWPGVK